MGKACDICGADAYEDLICTCSKCSTAREHVYCMRKCLMVVPEIWVCEECRSSDNTVSPVRCEKDQFSKSVASNIGMIHGKDYSSAGEKTISDDSVRNTIGNKQKIVGCGKVKFIPTEEVIMLNSGSRKMDSSLHDTLGKNSRSPNTVVSKSMKTSGVPKIGSPEKLPVKVKANSGFVPPAQIKSPRRINVSQAFQASKELQESKALLSLAKKNLSKEQPKEAFKPASECKTSEKKVEKMADNATCISSPLSSVVSESKALLSPAKKTFSKEQPKEAFKPASECKISKKIVERVADNATCISSPLSPVVSGGNSPADAEFEKSIVKEKSLLSILKSCEKYNPNPPSLNATWKGSFEIVGSAAAGKTYDGFHAHPPSKIHLKAYEFLKQMPATLQFKLLPRCSLWADIFQDDRPAENDIALYIVPGNWERSKQHYFCLLEGMEMHDSVMTCCMGSIELLIFTSKLLDMDFQKLYTKSFLWGVFRCVKDNEAITEEQKEVPLLPYHLESAHYDHGYEENNKKYIEIDMIGGKNVGIVDMPVSVKSMRRVSGSTLAESSKDMLRKSDGKNPSILRNVDSPIQLPLSEIKREDSTDCNLLPGDSQKVQRVFVDKLPADCSLKKDFNAMESLYFPPGFEEKFRPRDMANSCKNYSNAMDNGGSPPGFKEILSPRGMSNSWKNPSNAMKSLGFPTSFEEKFRSGDMKISSEASVKKEPPCPVSPAMKNRFMGEAKHLSVKVKTEADSKEFKRE